MNDAGTANLDPPKRKRRWFQFSLRTLLIAVTAVGLLCGLVILPALEQRRIVDELTGSGAIVGYDHADDFLGAFLKQDETWLDHLIGVDFFYTATGVCYRRDDHVFTSLRLAVQLPHLDAVDLTDCDVSDSDLAAIRGAKQLKHLELNLMGPEYTNGLRFAAEQRDPHLTAAGLACLENLTALETLSLSQRSCANDAGLAHLRGLTSLRSLDLTASPVAGAGLANLNCQDTLEELNLFWCNQLNDEDIKLIARFKRLRRLNLGMTQVTDRGLAELQKLPALVKLDLQDCKITDAGMAYIGKLKSLRELNLSSTKITDAGLRQLEPIGELVEVNLDDTGVTQNGVEEAAKHLHVVQWVIPQEWRRKVKLPKGQSIYGAPAPKEQ